MRLRILIPVTVLLIVAALIGFLQAAAKDDTTTTEGIIFWLSVAAMPFLLLALLILVGVGIWRIVQGFWLREQRPGRAQT
jgi:peptidoglycan/LPS O-acetylase OafA/YrhL